MRGMAACNSSESLSAQLLLLTMLKKSRIRKGKRQVWRAWRLSFDPQIDLDCTCMRLTVGIAVQDEE